MLLENDKMIILDNESVSEEFYNYFSQVVDFLDLYEMENFLAP